MAYSAIESQDGRSVIDDISSSNVFKGATLPCSVIIVSPENNSVVVGSVVDVVVRVSSSDPGTLVSNFAFV